MTRETQLSRLLSAVANLTDEVSGLRKEVTTLQTKVEETKEIVEAWGAVKTMGRFLKWFGGLVSGVTAIWLLAKVGLLHTIGGGK